jgi:hypothetical protein
MITFAAMVSLFQIEVDGALRPALSGQHSAVSEAHR